MLPARRLRQPSSGFRKFSRGHGYLKIGDVARLVGISASILRAWEALGLVSPVRTHSNYRLYTPRDVKVLKRAQFLRRVRGLNAPAIVLLLKRQGLISSNDQSKPGALGSRLRRLRLNAKLSLAAVARATEVSIGFLSALERGQMSASVATLRRLARFYNTNILALFDPSEAHQHHVRPSERRVLEAGSGVRMELLAWGNAVMEPHLFRIAPGAGSGEAYSHEGEEFLYVMQGKLEITLAENELHLLAQGDSFYFESSTRHEWKNPGTKDAVVIWVNTPPTF
ncbi:MAG TPA: cupin domain-containing protein [Candidatus Acidoferrales bacterium]|nr:cupin domain-containing protein [Candidatus Acidoferrales bacterium]